MSRVKLCPLPNLRSVLFVPVSLVVIETSIGLRSLFDVLRSRPRIRGAAQWSSRA
jgi:hypothetical protein